jgi:site-specific recombinase XerD
MKVKTINLRWDDIDMSELDLHKLIVHYGQSNKAEGKSPATVIWYAEMLGDFLKFLESTCRRLILNELDAKNVREFIIHERERLVSDYTVQGKVRALKAFSSWLMREGYTPDNVLVNVRLPKVSEKLIEPLTNDEIERLVSVQNPLTALGSRNIAVITALLDTGMRESELSNLRYEDAHIEEGFLKVFGKGSKERVLPIGGMTQKILWRYVLHFRPEPENDANAYLFLTLEGKKLQPNALKLLFNRWGKKTGVPRLHAHLCRHTFATNFLIHKCGDVFRLQQILGHNTLEMVRRYVHYASTQVMIRGYVSSPMDRMGIKGLRSYKIDKVLGNTRSNNRR